MHNRTRPDFGDLAADTVTGFTGIVTGIAAYISGCTQCSLAQRIGADGKPTEAQWFDIQRLVVVKKGAVIIEATPTGGPVPSGTNAAPLR